ncbi:stalk domain-containing protein [Brevibacillus ruminantium]|uniref:Stalk domain-containing protein n=1 Tax=Brevibacillus ruminantium TaxID=2950604 RepID=A0ABY4WFV0_9BACL|nr:stalk domain-containing protein [Brevibacillus ruminantium]USG65003.1 stalk domain-containing protein [Brevibacillus ruminantium]
MWKKKWVPIVSSVILAGAVLMPISTDAAVGKKTVQASYNNIKVMYNGAVVTTDLEPFIINGSTFIPLRMMANVFNKDVVWDGTNYTINVKDKPDTRVASLEAQLAERDSKIKSLESKISDLKDEVDKLERKKGSSSKDDFDDQLADLEKYLNREFGDFEDISWDISLDGDDEDDISVEIEVDLSDYEDEYDDLTKSQIRGFVEDICEAIWDEFKDADIEGVIIDSDEDEDLYEFEGDGYNNKVTLSAV